MNPTKVALLLLKVFTWLFILTLVVSIANMFPYYMALTNVANDVLMRATMNNYVRQAEIDLIMEETFNLQRSGSNNHQYGRDSGEINSIFNGLTYKDDGGIYIYAMTVPQEVAASGVSPFQGGSCNIGTRCSAWENPARKVIINETADFDPKTNDTHLIKFRGPSGAYKGAQRGDTIAVRVEGKINLKILFIGMNMTVGVPLRVTKSGPAMYYYRI